MPTPRHFDEVKSVGRHESRVRTPDQTHLAMWWKEFVESLPQSPGARRSSQIRLDLWEAGAPLCAAQHGIMDGYIGSFDAKFLTTTGALTRRSAGRE